MKIETKCPDKKLHETLIDTLGGRECDKCGFMMCDNCYIGSYKKGKKTLCKQCNTQADMIISPASLRYLFASV